MQNKDYVLIEKLIDKYSPFLEYAFERLPESPLKETLLGDFYEYLNTLSDDLHKADKMEIQFAELKKGKRKSKRTINNLKAVNVPKSD